MPRKGSQKLKHHMKTAAAASIAAKRKRQTLRSTSSSSCDRSSSSRKKMNLLGSKLHENNKCDGVMHQTWIIAHILQRERLLCEVLCPVCSCSGFSFSVVTGENAGYASKIKITCKNQTVTCSYSKIEMSSPKLNDSDKGTVAYQVNPKMVLFSHEIGGGYRVLQNFSAVMGMPPMALKTYQRHDNKVTAAGTESGHALLQRSVKAIRQVYADTDPDIQDALERGENPVIDIVVSYDGTWMKRGYTSLYIIGIAVDILTGLVVDYDLLSKYCHACSLKETSGLSPEELAQWKAMHEKDCCVTHRQSSKSMEQEAAKAIWRRSEKQHGLRYMEMLADGDSSAYLAVCNENPYGEDKVRKLECLNHASKRMGTALRKLSKGEKLGGRSVGRLTDKKCESLQNYYRGAIVNNLPDIAKMKSAVWATLWHSMSNDDQPHHHMCPKGETSWCFYQAAVARGEDPPPSHTEHMASTYLCTSVAHKLIPVYRRMSDDTLLSRMVHGYPEQQ